MIKIDGVGTKEVRNRTFKGDRYIVFYCSLQENVRCQYVSYRWPNGVFDPGPLLEIGYSVDSGEICGFNAVTMVRRMANPLDLPDARRYGAAIMAILEKYYTEIYSDVGIFFGSDFIDIELQGDEEPVECIVDNDIFFLLDKNRGLTGIRVSALPHEEIETARETFIAQERACTDSAGVLPISGAKTPRNPL